MRWFCRAHRHRCAAHLCHGCSALRAAELPGPPRGHATLLRILCERSVERGLIRGVGSCGTKVPRPITQIGICRRWVVSNGDVTTLSNEGLAIHDSNNHMAPSIITARLVIGREQPAEHRQLLLSLQHWVQEQCYNRPRHLKVTPAEHFSRLTSTRGFR